MREEDLETPVNKKLGKNKQYSYVRDQANYFLNKERLAQYVLSALQWIENFHGISNTFKKTHNFPQTAN